MGLPEVTTPRPAFVLARDDYQCGYAINAACNPHSHYPCCSASGWCGSKPEHCNCDGCFRYAVQDGKLVALRFDQRMEAAKPFQPYTCSFVDLPPTVRVFQARESGVDCFRIPAIVVTSKGSLLAFAEARYSAECHDSEAKEIMVKRSTDHGRTWSALVVAAGSKENPLGNPYPIALRTGRVLLVFVHHAVSCSSSDCSEDSRGNGIVISDDDGLTWSAGMDVSRQFQRASGSMPGPGAGIELSGPGPSIGRLLVVPHQGQYNWDHIVYSDDAGKTWTYVNQSFRGMDEGTLADLGGGNVLLSMRHTEEFAWGRAMARSSDGGLTWNDVYYDRTLVGPICQASLAAIGKHVYFANPNHATRRKELTLRRSDDGGKSWSRSLVLQEDESTGYSSIVHGTVRDDMHSGILYETAGSPGTIEFRVFPLDLS